MPVSAAPGMLVHEIHRLPKRIGGNEGVRIQQQNIAPTHVREGLVIRPTEADVGVIDDELDLRELRLDQLDAALHHRVVEVLVVGGAAHVVPPEIHRLPGGLNAVHGRVGEQ